jgi:hypothetical protein
MLNVDIRITGTSPLLLSCDRLADPLDPMTIEHKKLTSTRGKTEDDHEKIAFSQWRGLLYWDDKLGVFMPTQNIRAAIIRGGTLNKLGTQIKRGSLMDAEKVAIDYGKKLTIEQLWKQRFLDRRSVVVSRARVMCYRPKFSEWTIPFSIQFDENIMDLTQLEQSIKNAGLYVGIGGFRPEKGGPFGRFVIESISKPQKIEI